MAPQTAWEVVHGAYTTVQATYPDLYLDRPDIISVALILDLPVVRSLVMNRRGRHSAISLGKSISGHSHPSRRNQNPIAALSQVTGPVNRVPCRRCRGGSGRWSSCVENPTQIRQVLPFNCCANCAYNLNGKGRCRLGATAANRSLHQTAGTPERGSDIQAEQNEPLVEFEAAEEVLHSPSDIAIIADQHSGHDHGVEQQQQDRLHHDSPKPEFDSDTQSELNELMMRSEADEGVPRSSSTIATSADQYAGWAWS